MSGRVPSAFPSFSPFFFFSSRRRHTRLTCDWSSRVLFRSDYVTGEKIDHADGVTVEEAEHQIATRLYQNTARVHFNLFAQSKDRFGKRLIYGGHAISRSEERRVGKECRAGWAPCNEEKKQE